MRYAEASPGPPGVAHPKDQFGEGPPSNETLFRDRRWEKSHPLSGFHEEETKKLAEERAPVDLVRGRRGHRRLFRRRHRDRDPQRPAHTARRPPLAAIGGPHDRRLYESPFTDNAPQGPDMIFTEEQVDDIVSILDEARSHVLPDVTVA